jgi:hypothetical protein
MAAAVTRQFGLDLIGTYDVVRNWVIMDEAG